MLPKCDNTHFQVSKTGLSRTKRDRKKESMRGISPLRGFKYGLGPICVWCLTTLSSLATSCYAQARSKRSRFITLFHAATKSCRNFSWESSQA